MQAVGVYFKTLRTKRQLSPKDIVNAIMDAAPELDPPDVNYVWRIENGKIQSPGFRLIAALTRAVQGNPDDVVRLVLDEDVSADEAERLALAWLSRDQAAQIDELVENHTAEDVLAAIRDMREELGRLERRLGPPGNGA